VIDALLAVFESRMSSPDDASTLHALMREVFPSSLRLRASHSRRLQSQQHRLATDSVLTDAIATQLRASSLQLADSLVSKVVPLFTLCVSEIIVS